MTVPRVLPDSAALAGLALRRMVRYPGLVFAIVVFPAVFLTGFVVLLRRSFEAQGIDDYVQYVVPIVVVQACLFTGMGTAVTMAMETESGMLARLKAMPISRYALFGGPALGYLVRAGVVLIIVLGLGIAYGFRFDGGVTRTLGFLVVAVVFAAVAVCGYACLGLALGNSELTQSMILVPYAPLLLLSTGFSPEQNWPGWLQPVVGNNPVSTITDAMRGLASGTDVSSPLLQAMGWLAAGLAFALAAGNWLVRKPG